MRPAIVITITAMLATMSIVDGGLVDYADHVAMMAR
jgi:hypothetical protein